MTSEKKILMLIEEVINNPYRMSVKMVMKRFRLSEEKVLWLIENLNLEIKGFRQINERRYLMKYIESNFVLDKNKIIKETGLSRYIVEKVLNQLKKAA